VPCWSKNLCSLPPGAQLLRTYPCWSIYIRTCAARHREHLEAWPDSTVQRCRLPTAWSYRGSSKRRRKNCTSDQYALGWCTAATHGGGRPKASYPSAASVSILLDGVAQARLRRSRPVSRRVEAALVGGGKAWMVGRHVPYAGTNSGFSAKLTHMAWCHDGHAWQWFDSADAWHLCNVVGVDGRRGLFVPTSGVVN
jgi:hypothetical protein